MPIPRKDYYDDEYRGPTYDAPLYGYFPPMFVLFCILFMILFCFTAAWCALQPPAEAPPARRHNHVIRYRLIRTPPNNNNNNNDDDGGRV